MRSNYSGYSDTTSMMTTSTDPSVSYLDASGRPHNRNRLISEITDLDERTLDLKDEDKALLRKTVLARQLSGDPSKLNPNITLNEQAKIMVYPGSYNVTIGGRFPGIGLEKIASWTVDPRSNPRKRKHNGR